MGEFAALKKTKEMLIKEFLSMNAAAKGSKEDAVQAAKNNNAQIEHTKEKTNEGWVGSPKGIL